MCIHAFVWVSLRNLFDYIPRSEIDHTVHLMFNFFEELPNYFPQWLNHFTFPLAMYKCSSFSTSFSTLDTFHQKNYSHPSGREVISHCDFDLHFSNDHWPEKAMAPHSSTLAWKIPWAEEPGRLQSMGSLRVGHDWATSFSLFTFMHWRRKWQPIPVFLPGESQGWGSLVGCRVWGRTESDTTEVT